MLTPAVPDFLAQVPSPSPAVPSAGTGQPTPETTPTGQIVGIGGAVLALLLAGLVVRRATRRRAAPPPEQAPALPETHLPTRLRVELPPSEAERALVREADAARDQAADHQRQRNLLQMELRRAPDASTRARIEAESAALKTREEEAKREEYRARKAAEVETRERRKREVAEAERLEQQARDLQAAEAAAERAAEEAAARARVQAEAGQTLAQGLDRTRNQGFMARLNGLFGTTRAVDESVLVELEEVLFTADIGVRTASSLVELARDKLKRNELSSPGRMKALIRGEVERIVSLPVPRSLEGGGPPHVVMVVGVNGAGKTTTIGKLAAKLGKEGKQVVLAAGDTFRAAAAEQLDVWSERAHAKLVKGAENSDPGSVVFEAVKLARESGAHVVIADTAGRLHTQAPLMEELKKVKRVIDKALPGAPHEVLLVLDATNGQNAIQQAKQFHEAVGVTAIALTKLDGTAKGGVIIGICDELKLPVVWVGVGEKVEDLRRFDPGEFVAALFD